MVSVKEFRQIPKQNAGKTAKKRPRTLVGSNPFVMEMDCAFSQQW